MADIVKFPAASRPRPIEASEQKVLQEIFLAEHAHLAHALENIGSASLELQAVNTIAVLRDTNAIGDMISEEVLVGLAKAMIHLFDARGSRTAERPARAALADLVHRFEGVPA